MNKKTIPIRKCLGCGERKPQNELIRAVKSHNEKGEKVFCILTANHKKDGRSAYICKSQECFAKAKKGRKFEKAFSSQIASQFYEELEKAVAKMNKSPLLSFLGIALKSGNLILGMDNIKKHIPKGKIKLILIAKDISENSSKKIQKYKSEIEIISIDITKEEIYYALGKNSAILAVTDDNFVQKIKSIINELDNNEITERIEA